MEAIVFDGSSNAKAQLIHLEPVPGGQYRATHNLTLKAEGEPSVVINGEVQPLQPSLALAPALHFYFNAHARKIITDVEVASEVIRLSALPPARSAIFVNGTWVGPAELMRLHAEATANRSGKYPVPVAIRMTERPSFTNINDALASALFRGPNAVEYLLPTNLLTMTSAQELVVGVGIKRNLLPWQTYKEYFDHVIPADVLAFESGKASADDTKQFPEMFHAGTFVILKETVLLNGDPEKVINYVHSPTVIHHRMYERWGWTKVQDSLNGNGHRLYSITLAQMLQLKHFNPEMFSERMRLTRSYSENDLSFVAARRMSQTLKQLMVVYLDASFAPLGQPGSRIRVDDRSLGFYRGADVLLAANGIIAREEEYKRALQQIKTARYTSKESLSHVPEEFDPNQIEGNLFIQELSDDLARKDPTYLAKVLAAVAKWYQQKTSAFMNLNAYSMDAQQIVFSVMTRSQILVAQARALGLSVRQVPVNTFGVVDHHGGIAVEKDKVDPYFGLSVPLPWILQNLQRFENQGTVKQGQWAQQAELLDPVLD
jgi:hypothetical protein